MQIDWNPMDSPVAQAFVAHASTLGLGAVLAQPQVLASFVPPAYQPLAMALMGLFSGFMAKQAHSAAMSATPPAKNPLKVQG